MLAAASSAITSLFARYGPQSVRASLSPCLAKESATPSLPSHLNRPGQARGGHGPAELAPETHLSRACPTELCGVPSERIGFVCIIPRVSPWASIRCPAGALRRSCQPPCVARSWRQRDLGCTATIVFPRGRIFVLKKASGTLAVARLGGEHHTHSRAARKPILSRVYSARGGHGPAEPAPETHHRSITPRDGHANAIHSREAGRGIEAGQAMWRGSVWR